MSAGAVVAADTKKQTDRRLDLIRRFTLAGFDDTSMFDQIPHNAVLFLLPDDDAEFVAREMRIGLRAVKRGENVYFRHVRVNELPE